MGVRRILDSAGVLAAISTGDCAICGRRLRSFDAVECRDFPDVGVVEAEVHTACTADGVRRWLRESNVERPLDTPLDASRVLRWSWGGEAERRGGHDSASFYDGGDGTGERYYPGEGPTDGHG